MIFWNNHAPLPKAYATAAVSAGRFGCTDPSSASRVQWRSVRPRAGVRGFDWREVGEFADRSTLKCSRPYHLPSLSMTAFEFPLLRRGMSISFLLSSCLRRLLAGVGRRRDRNPQDNAAFKVFVSFIQIGRLAWGDVADRRPRAGPRPKNAEEKAHKNQRQA